MTFNEFKRELDRRVKDPQISYMLAFMFEAITAQNQQLDEMASLLLNLAEQQQRFVDFNAQTQETLKRVERRGRPDGVEVHSVSNDPETEH